MTNTYNIPANLVTTVEGWRYWDGEKLPLLAYAPVRVFKVEDNGKSTQTPQ